MGDQSPPPLGLKLTRTASLDELIQKILDEENEGFAQEENKGSVQEDENKGLVQEENRDLVQEDENRGLIQEENKRFVHEDENKGLGQDQNRGLVVATNGEKQQASNFQATFLKIGSWEWTSRYAGDLVAKIYFGKRLIVWEVLEDNLKSKIEFPWSSITAFKSSLPENQSGTLTIMLNKPPMFSKETNQQAKQHTKWKPTSDFTNGQASKYKQHVLICSPGIMNKHIEKLLQSDHDLFRLSQKPEISLDSPVFDVGPSRLDDPSLFGSQNMALFTDLAQEDENKDLVQEDENKGLAVATNGEKQKASNFQATYLKIGSWEWTSRYPEDLVAKIYFGKRLIVWEVLEDNLKSKIEFPWSSITAFKSSLPENQSGTLTIMLDDPPMFSKEINQQAKKTTKWKTTSDFTNGEASKYNQQHVLICGPGIMNKHIEKLLQSDHDLFRLSQEPE